VNREARLTCDYSYLRRISRESGLAMCFTLIEVAEGRWRRVNAPELVALVRAGAKFVKGWLVARTDREDAA
jgi:hypothetical protein